MSVNISQPPGTLVFGRIQDDNIPVPGGSKLWDEGTAGTTLGTFRADFDPPADAVTIDLLCTDDDRGFLRVFNESETQMDEVLPGICRGDGVGFPTFFRVTLNPAFGIAFALAGALAGDGVFLDNLQVEFLTLPVFIDIKPRDVLNRVNICASRPLRVAILSFDNFSGSTFFDATDVDPATVFLAGAGVVRLDDDDEEEDDEDVQFRTRIRDVNEDGLRDLIVWIVRQDLNLDTDDTEAILVGQTFDGKAIKGKDAVEVKQFMCLRELDEDD